MFLNRREVSVTRRDIACEYSSANGVTMNICVRI